MAIDFEKAHKPHNLIMPVADALSDYGALDTIQPVGWPGVDDKLPDTLSPVVTGIDASLVDRLLIATSSQTLIYF